MWWKLSLLQTIALIVFVGLPLVSMAAYLIARAVLDAMIDSRLRAMKKYLSKREEAYRDRETSREG